MKFILNYTDYLLESKKSKFKFEVDAISHLNDTIRDISKRDKFSQILLKDIFNNYKLFINDTSFPQKNTNDKIEAINDVPVRNKIIAYYKDEMHNISDYINNCDLNTITATNIKELIESANDYHNGLDVTFKAERTDEGNNTDKFIVYPNGWYWINLNVEYSKDEAENMGHCGRDDGKIIFSLRDDKKQSHITASYKPSNETIYQIKGRKNSKPTSKYHKMIIDMLTNNKYNIIDISDDTYRPELNFSVTDLSEELARLLFSKKPDLEYTDTMLNDIMDSGDYDALIALYEKGMTKIPNMGYLNKGYDDMLNFIHYIRQYNTEFYGKFIKMLYKDKKTKIRYDISLTKTFIKDGVLTNEQAIENVDFKSLLKSDTIKTGKNLEDYLILGYKPSSYDELLDGLYQMYSSDIFEPILEKYKVCWNFKPTSKLIEYIIDRDIPYSFIYLFDWSDYMFTEYEYSRLRNTVVQKVFLLSQRKTEICENIEIDIDESVPIFKPSNVIHDNELHKTKIDPSLYKKYIGYATFFSNEKLYAWMEIIKNTKRYISSSGMDLYGECFKRNLVSKQYLIDIINENIELFGKILSSGFYNDILSIFGASDYYEFNKYLEKNYDEYTVKKIKAMI